MRRRLTVFAKGNVDVHDSLHSCRLGGVLEWNGLNEALRERSFTTSARIRHETWTRSDALLEATGEVPAAFVDRDLPLAPHPLAAQFSSAVFESPSDVVVLSIQPDVCAGLLRHRDSGKLLLPSNLQAWSEEDRRWVSEAFDRIAPLSAAQAMANLAAIVERLRSPRDVPILIYTLSPIVPGEALACYQGIEETVSERIRRFNLGLIDLSRDTGVHLVDVDRLVAEKGADALKRDAVHLSPAAYRLAAHEVVRILLEIGLLEEEP